MQIPELHSLAVSNKASCPTFVGYVSLPECRLSSGLRGTLCTLVR